MKNQKMNSYPELANYFLYHSLFISLVRISVYCHDIEHVTKVKVTQAAWKDPRIREVMYAYSYAVFLFLCFRHVIFMWATYLPESVNKRLLCSIVWAFDVYMCYRIFFPYKKTQGNEESVMQHQQKALPPKILQSSLVLSGIAFHFSWLVLGL